MPVVAFVARFGASKREMIPYGRTRENHQSPQGALSSGSWSV
jgi:hypothetical protein